MNTHTHTLPHGLDALIKNCFTFDLIGSYKFMSTFAVLLPIWHPYMPAYEAS